MGSGGTLAKNDGANINYSELLKKMKKKFFEAYEANKPSDAKELENLKVVVSLGEGSFGKVFLVKNKKDETYYAMKVFEKSKIMKSKQLQHTMAEKKVLQAVNFPFIVSLEFSMKDNVYIYFVLPYECGGDMFYHLSKMNKFDEKLAKFYAAQVLLAIEYLHFCDVLYRDLKPENILICASGYLKLTDLGFCKLVKSRTWTLCGTPEYIAPEIILSKGYGKTVDWWSFGILIYEMNAGYSPFCAKDPIMIYERITSGKYKVPQHFSLHLKDIVKNLLQNDLSKRFGNLKNGIADIKNHAWFGDTDFISLFLRKVTPPFTPTTVGPEDTSNFETKRAPSLRRCSQDLFKDDFESF